MCSARFEVLEVIALDHPLNLHALIPLMSFDLYFKIFSLRVDGVMRTMNTEKLLKTIPIIQNQMDALLDFNVS